VAESIFALASAPGRAAIAVWRLSGPDVAAALSALTGRAPPPQRLAVVRIVSDPATGTPLDRAMILFMPGPASFTGEDMVELHTHGGRAVGEAIAAALGRLPGFRPAEPGEFTRRAFMNGKLDLTSAEAIADLAAAETEAQRQQAMRQAGGALASLYDGWRDRLVRLRGRMEADIEFPDEDVGDPLNGVAGDLAGLRREIADHLADARRGERLRDGLTVAVIGQPNAGKSSLINALAGRDVAIVSPEAGTTRDAIEVHLDLGGYPVTLVDTAGLRAAEGVVEAEGIRRARARAATADIVLALFPANAADDAATLALIDSRTIAVTSKADQADGPVRALAISTVTQAGLDVLLRTLSARAAALLEEHGSPPPTRQRHCDALRRCLEALDDAASAPLPELAAEQLRRAADELGRIVGRIDIDDMLDSIFREFCIGK
jgi:tRNA modification GTPase